jgi:hypothetical protein
VVRVTLKLTYEVAVVTASFRRLPRSIALNNSTSWLCLSHPKILQSTYSLFTHGFLVFLIHPNTFDIPVGLGNFGILESLPKFLVLLFQGLALLQIDI